MNNQNQNDRAAWLEGSSVTCSTLPSAAATPWRLVLLGPPGVGKGTQAGLLAQRLGACHLSTGDVFRAACKRSVREQTPAMASAVELMRSGYLVPDEIVSQMVRERLRCLQCRGGFVLDGFPRTVLQANLLQELLDQEHLQLDAVISYKLRAPEIVDRLSGRRICEQCKAIYHLTAHPPRRDGVCDLCGGWLYQRDDDRADSITVRLEACERSSAALIHFYRDSGLLRTVDASGSAEEIFERTIAALKPRRGSRTVNVVEFAARCQAR